MSDLDEAFGEFRDKKPIGPHEGVAGILLCASACDGHIADEEVQSLMQSLGRMKLYQRTTPNQFSSMMDRLMGILRRGGPEGLMNEVIGAVPPELAETVLALATNIVLADGVVDDDEKEFINDLRTRLEISEEQSSKIIKVMVIKNRG